MRKKTFALYPNGKARHQTVKLLALVIARVYVAFTALYDKNGRENDQAAFLQKDGLFAAYFFLKVFPVQTGTVTFINIRCCHIMVFIKFLANKQIFFCSPKQ